jgi:hypothetical protein
MVVIESQHDHERDPVVLASERDRRELVHRLLVEAHVDPAEVALLDYELDAWHLGVIATGAKAAHALEELQMGLGCELLSISHGRSSWAWLGGSRQIKTAALERALSHGRHRDVSFVPLRGQKDGGAALRKTLRAYVDADCSASSAESTAGVGRHAVADRVRTAEQLIGQAIRACLPELDVALRLEELEEHRARRSSVRRLG